MARSHIVSAIFLTLLSANIIQGGVVRQFFNNEEAFPNLVNLIGMPRFGEFSHNTASAAANAATNVFDGFRTYVDNFRTGLGQYLTISPTEYPTLHRFVHGDIWPSFTSPAAGAYPGGFVAPGLGGNYGGVRNGGGGASAAAASSAASGGVAKR